MTAQVAVLDRLTQPSHAALAPSLVRPPQESCVADTRLLGHVPDRHRSALAAVVGEHVSRGAVQPGQDGVVRHVSQGEGG